MTEPDPELIQLFTDESNSRLDEMDTALLAVEAGNADPDALGELFRNAHTIKGAAGLLGYDDIRTLAHVMEDVLAVIRERGEFPPDLVPPLLRGTAALRSQVAGSGADDEGLAEELAACREALLAGNGAAASQPALSGEPSPAAGSALPADGAPPAPAGPPGIPAAPPAPAPSRPAVPASPAAGQPSYTQPAPPAPAAPIPTAKGPGPAATRPATTGPANPGPATTGPATVGPATVGPAATERRPAAKPAAAGGGQGRTLRVPADKIDNLLDLVGEVMQNRRRMSHALEAEADASPELADMLDAGERMLAELTDSAVGMRLLPVSAITGPLPRAVRDVARGEGKEVEFVVTGADTELDRVILEALSEPLTHLLRNSVIHGIESPDERRAAGKPTSGVIELRAVPRGGLVEIVVSDDGRGVSQELMEQARGEGSLADLLARPGFSTASQVTDLAGRGVGMDAVKSQVQALGGSFGVRSEPGQGMSVILLLPLALALLNVLLFERGGAVFGVPLAAVEEVVSVTPVLTLEGRPTLDVRGRPLPVSDVAVLIGAKAPPQPVPPPGLIVSASGHRVVVSCDELRGEEEVVVKPLGPLLDKLEGYLGAAILGDGRIALLLEPSTLIRGRDHTTAAARAVRPQAGPPKILVAEDSFTVRELQRSILEAAGYQVTTARDGAEALETVGRDPEIALVLSDLEMPQLDGLGLTRAIRADPARSSLPVVIITSRGSDEDRRRGIEAGADAYMSKQGFDQQALLATVERLVGR